MHRHRRVWILHRPLVLWKFELHLLLPHFPKSPGGPVDMELLWAPAMSFWRCLHQYILQRWPRLQVCSCRSDFCSCSNRRSWLEQGVWGFEGRPLSLWWSNSILPYGDLLPQGEAAISISLILLRPQCSTNGFWSVEAFTIHTTAFIQKIVRFHCDKEWKAPYTRPSETWTLIIIQTYLCRKL